VISDERKEKESENEESKEEEERERGETLLCTRLQIDNECTDHLCL
jgi:hypothetical protein